jgi:hypothetical protein
MIGTQQPAISRVEKADYQNWSFNTLRKIVDAEDARVRVSIQPAEDVLKEYETEAVEQPIDKEFVTALTNQLAITNPVAVEQPAHQNLYINPWQANQGTRGVGGFSNALVAPLYAWRTFADTTLKLRNELAARNHENARLKMEIARLKTAFLVRMPGSQDSKLADFEGVDPQLLATASFVGQQPPGRAI